MACLAEPWQTVNPQSGNLPTIDQAQVRKSPPARDQVLTTEPHAILVSVLLHCLAAFTDRDSVQPRPQPAVPDFGL